MTGPDDDIKKLAEGAGIRVEEVDDAVISADSAAPIESTMGALNVAALEAEAQMDRIRDAINSLSTKEQQLIALLGFNSKVGKQKLPKNFKAIRISFPEERLGQVSALIRKFGYPCNNGNFAGGVDSDLADSSSVTLDAVVPFTQPAGPALESLIVELEKFPHMLYIDQSDSTTAVFVSGNGVSVAGANYRKFKDSDKTTLKEKRPTADSLQEVDVIPESLYSSKSLLFAKKEETNEAPNAGPCSYLWIEGSFVDGSGKKHELEMKQVLTQLKVSGAISRNFRISAVNGGILMVDTAQRGFGEIVNIADGLNALFKGRIKMLVSKGGIVRRDYGDSRSEQVYSIDGLPDHKDMKNVLDLLETGGVYSLKNLYDKENERFIDREGARFQTLATEVLGTNMIKLASHVQRAKLRVGGPDIFIDPDGKYEELESAYVDDAVKLIKITGEAGMGKSRLMDELRKRHPEILTVTMNPSGKTSRMDSLVTMIGDVTTYIEDKGLKGLSDTLGDDISELINFSKKAHGEKREIAMENPEMIANLLSKCLVGLAEETGGIPIFIDDFHDMDRDSEPHIVKILSRLAQVSGTKIITAMRHDERLKSLESAEYQRFESQIVKSGGFKHVGVNGLPLDQEKVARDFAYYSLPKDIRSQHSSLAGNWYIEFGKWSMRQDSQDGSYRGVPLRMVRLMNILKLAHARSIEEGSPSPFKIGSSGIDIDPEVFEKAKAAAGFDDLDAYECDRLKDIPPVEREAMQYIALMGGTVTDDQLAKFEHIVGGRISVRGLVERMFLIKESEGVYSYKYPTMINTMISLIQPHDRIRMAKVLYENLKDDPSIDSDALLNVFHDLGDVVGFEDEGFWHEYGSRTEEKHKAYAEKDAHKAIYGLAMNVLDGMNGKLKTPMGELFRTLVEVESLPENLATILIENLTRVGRSAIELGKFENATKAMKCLQILIDKGIVPEDKLEGISLLMFDVEDLVNNLKSDGLTKIYKERLNEGASLSPVQRALCEVMIVYREMIQEFGMPDNADRKDEIALLKKQKAERIREKYKTDIEDNRFPSSPFYKQWAAITELIECRIPFEGIRDQVEQIVDSDVMINVKALTPDQKKQMRKISREITTLINIKNNKPGTFSPVKEMLLLDEAAQIKAFMAETPEDFDEADKLYSEYWRQAHNIDSKRRVVRAAKLRGDFIITKMLRNDVVDPDEIRKALEVYSKHGINHLHNVDDGDIYQISLRVGRIRANGLLVKSLMDKADREPMDLVAMAKMKEEVSGAIDLSFKDIKYLQDDPKWKKWLKDPEIQYYVNGCTASIVQAAQKFNLRHVLPKGFEDWDCMSDENIAAGLKYAEGKAVKNPDLSDLGENQRKKASLKWMKNYLTGKRTSVLAEDAGVAG